MSFLMAAVLVCVCLFSQSLWAFVAGDKVKLSVNPKLGPYTVEKCYLEDSQQVCKVKEAGYLVNSTYLRKHDASVKLATSKDADETSAVRIQVLGR